MASLTLSLTDTLIGGRQTIQQVIVSGFPFFSPSLRREKKESLIAGYLCTDQHVSHHTNRESHAFDFCYGIWDKNLVESSNEKKFCDR